MDYVEGMTLRQRINAAMALLDHAAARADLELISHSHKLMVVIRAFAPSPTKTGGKLTFLIDLISRRINSSFDVENVQLDVEKFIKYDRF